MGSLLLKVLALTLTFGVALTSNALSQNTQNTQSSATILSRSEQTVKMAEDEQQSPTTAGLTRETRGKKLFTESCGQQVKQAGLPVEFQVFGYNSLKGCPLTSGRDPGFTFPIFAADYSISHVTTDSRYNIPRGVLVSPDVSCVPSFTSEVVQTPYDLTKLLAVTARLSGPGWGPSFAASDNFRKLSTELRQNVLVVSTATCSSYHVTLSPLELPPVHPMFLDWVLKVNNTDDEDVYLEFFDTFGTHFVSSARFGASLSIVHKMKGSAYRRYTGESVTAAASYSAAVLLGQSATLTSAQLKDAKEFRNQVETNMIATGVIPLTNSKMWLTAVEDKPVAISYDLTSVEVLFSEAFMGKRTPLQRYDLDYIRIKTTITDVKKKYCQTLQREGLLHDCEDLSPGLELLHTKLTGRAEYRAILSADQCIDECYQLAGCVAVTLCPGCDSSDVGDNVCRTFSAGDIHSAVTDPQWQTTILLNKLQRELKLHNTSVVVDSSGESDSLNMTSSHDCYISCLEDVACMAFTLRSSPGERITCTRHSDSHLSLKQETGVSLYFLSQSSKQLVGSRQTSLSSSFILNDWYKATCVLDDECRQENSMCFLDRCLCRPGFFFSTRDYTCSASCSPGDLQSSVVDYPHSGLRGHNLQVVNGLDLQACNNLCASNTSCVTFDFRASGGRCLLHDVTSREVSSGWYPLTSRGWTHYQRTCLHSPASYPGPACEHKPCNNSNDCPDPLSRCLSGRCWCQPDEFSPTNKSFDKTAESCREWQQTGAKSGVYLIRLPGESEIHRVWCDMDSSDGGWLVFQRRRDGSVDFYRNWTQYENGFGDVTGEFWLGLSRLHTLTKGRQHRLRVDLSEKKGHHHYAEYSSFRVDGPETNYRLTLSGYSGNASDSMEYSNGLSFSTHDRDNDKWSDVNCADYYHGAWWYIKCGYSNLNGRYKADEGEGVDGIFWYHAHNDERSFTFSEMKVKAV